MEDTAHRGILAVWNDRVADIADFYEWWYVKQHLPERVGLPGWRYGRRYELMDVDSNSPQFFTWYELDNVAASASEEYRARLNDPTPETVRVMQNWRNMSRTICERTYGSSPVSGAYCVTAQFEQAPHDSMIETTARALAHEEFTVGVQTWRSKETPGSGESAESDIRSTPDGHIGAALVVDCMRHGDVAKIVRSVEIALDSLGLKANSITSYRYLCEYRDPLL